MKISKLFHWLYGVIMLLPIFAIGVTCLTCLWNKEIKTDNEIANITYKHNSNDVTNLASLQVGNIYNYQLNKSDFGTSYTLFFYATEFTINQIKFTASYNNDDSTSNYVGLSANSSGNIYIKSQNYGDSYFCSYAELPETQIVEFVYYPYADIDLSKVSKCTNLEIESVNITYEETEFDTKNVFYYSIDKVQQSPLFNWAYNSFLVTPFAYIVSLFSMPTNSFVVMLLSYWLAISIIWLVFDLVMYIPLLVHRWIDRGILQ